jgi:hypothetical protein
MLNDNNAMWRVSDGNPYRRTRHGCATCVRHARVQYKIQHFHRTRNYDLSSLSCYRSFDVITIFILYKKYKIIEISPCRFSP